MALHNDTQASTIQVVSGSSRTVANTTAALSPHDVYEKAKDSVAFITSQISQSSGGPFGQTQQGTATGSGFVVSSDGYIVTNDHVVAGATSVKAKIGDGKTLDAKVVGTDASTDLALPKVDASGLTPLTLADSPTSGRRSRRRDRQPLRPRPDAHHRRISALQRQISSRTATRSTTCCRPTPRSTPATPAARCSTPPAR